MLKMMYGEDDVWWGLCMMGIMYCGDDVSWGL